MVREISPHAGAAKMIRQYMRANGIAGRVNADSYAGGNSVNVYVDDMPPAAYHALEVYANQYQYGNFDGMQDLYEYSNVNRDIPQVKYVFVNNRISDEMRQRIWEFAVGYYEGMDGAPALAQDAGMFHHAGMRVWGDIIIHREFRDANSGFWNFVNNAQLVA